MSQICAGLISPTDENLCKIEAVLDKPFPAVTYFYKEACSPYWSSCTVSLSERNKSVFSDKYLFRNVSSLLGNSSSA